jgi:hypothetical protein
VATRRGFQAGPILAAWGAVWLVGALSQYSGFAHADLVFAATMGLAVIVSVVVGLGDRPSSGGRRGLLGGAVAGLTLFGLVAILMPIDPLAAKAVISFLIGAAFAFAGVWRGTRLALVGLALCVIVLIAWFGAREHLQLVVGLAGGGLLLLGGLWLWSGRKGA